MGTESSEATAAMATDTLLREACKLLMLTQAARPATPAVNYLVIPPGDLKTPSAPCKRVPLHRFSLETALQYCDKSQ